MKDILLLKVGRHFRFRNSKIVVGRNQSENDQLRALKSNDDILLEPVNCKGPTSILQGGKNREAILLAARLTARYSKCKNGICIINYKYNKIDETIEVEPLPPEEAEFYNINVKLA